MRAHAAALRRHADKTTTEIYIKARGNSTAEQPSNRGLKRFQYPVVVRGSSPVEIEATDSKVLEVLTPESEHWRGLQLDPNHRLLIRRSLVRAQVGEPRYSRGCVRRRRPFVSLCRRSRSYVESAGEMTLVAELFDSKSGDVIARVVDRREARSTGRMSLSGSV